ncbi:MAG: hypothetical protein FWE34_07120 [Defluviitaleaceae bacterium]|nr:hypothetical protein [Defluviitaleaceae bacterium]
MTMREHILTQIETLPTQALEEVVEFIAFQKHKLGPLDNETSSPTLDEQIVSAIMAKNPEITDLDTDKNGNAIIDKKTSPNLYDWAVNG